MSQKVKRKNTPAPPKSPWPFVVMAVGVVLIIVVGSIAWRGSNSSAGSDEPLVKGGARLSVDRTSIDFGRVPLDIPVKATFQFKNVGDQPLTIKGEPRVELVRGC
jgi:hypothetical protein